MSYEEVLFTRYGAPCTDSNITLRIYLIHPGTISKREDIARYDKSAARDIEALETHLAALKEYRRALAARYSQLETMPYTERVELERYPSSTRGIQYYIRIVRRYEDGSEVNQLSETYDGKQRHIALKRFAEIQKQRPGIEAIKDIERRPWER